MEELDQWEGKTTLYDKGRNRETTYTAKRKVEGH
jgi:hypothetical protein